MALYRGNAALDAVRLPDGSLLLSTDVSQCRLEGASAAVVAERLLPALASWCTDDQLLSALPEFAGDDIRALIDELHTAGMLQVRVAAPAEPGIPAAAALAGLGLAEDDIEKRLRSLQIAIFGLDRTGLIIADALAAAGIGQLCLADTWRQDNVKRELAGYSRTEFVLAPPLSRESVEPLVEKCDLSIVTVDRNYLAARHWVNRAALASGRPALFCDVGLNQAIVGPLVLPGESSCYMCLRMRHLATAENFAKAFANEQHFDAKRDAATFRPLLPGVAEVVAGLLIGEAIRLLFGPLIPNLANRVLQYDPLGGIVTIHEFLRQPDCPHCRGIDGAVRVGPA